MNELRRRNYLKNLFVGMASFKLRRNIERIRARIGTHSNSIVPVVNISKNDGITFTRKDVFNMGKPQHQFSDYLRAKANTIHDVGQSALLNVIADAFDDFQKQMYLEDETNVIKEGND